ncbi:hypothetical protein [Paenibacillus hexagrammi]|uniref:Uncharacterized protein n=1 Tax=Paenibacillus hexagrammi TaxID=2908839 RepID=A0ABY3SRQ6_9BACL|nr:hypothetical protein [Paenibacillus sp. YPD9-1]UJF35841.1 hypothetical protein L0M14_12620 [Paenibacillus sp. YPD9-1]
MKEQTKPAVTGLIERLRGALDIIKSGGKLDETANTAFIEDIESLLADHARLKQDAVKLRSTKRSPSRDMESMSTRLKEALRE